MLLSLTLLAALSVPARSAGLDVVSYNIAGIPFVHELVERRVNAIAHRLRDSSYDIVGLQEVWLPWNKSAFIQVSGLPHHARMKGDGVFGSGLLLLSRHPIVETAQHVFASRPLRLLALDGEALARKGAQFARVRTPSGDLDVYNTHFTSPKGRGDYADYRLMQVFELYEFISAHSLGRPVVVMGDFNLKPEEPAVSILERLLGLRDSCAGLGKGACPTNSKNDHIDYIFTSAGAPAPRRVAVTFKELLPASGRDIPYSDHKAMEASFLSSLTRRPLRPDPKAQRKALEELKAELSKLGRWPEGSNRARQVEAVMARLEGRLSLTARTSTRR